MVEDVGKSFGYENESTIYGKLKRLIDAHMVEISEEFVENGRKKNKYRKLIKLIV